MEFPHDLHAHTLDRTTDGDGEYMEANNLDDDAVAIGIKRSRVTVSRIRRRKVPPAWDTIAKLREFTKDQVTADDFQSIEAGEAA